MRSAVILLVSFTVFGAGVLAGGPCRGAGDAPVIALDVETSPVQSASAIDSIYSGDAARLYVFLIVREFPDHRVSAYDLGYRVFSPDSSAVNLGFTRLPGWHSLDPSGTAFPGDTEARGATPPVAIGYWTLVPAGDKPPAAYITVTSNPYGSFESAAIQDEAGESHSPKRTFGAFINTLPAADVEARHPRSGFVRRDWTGRPIPEDRGVRVAGDRVIVRLAPGVVDLPEGSREGRIADVGTGDVRRVAESLGINRVERLYAGGSGGEPPPPELRDVYVLHFPDGAPVWAIVDSLRALPGCKYAEPDFLAEPFAAPNDSFYVEDLPDKEWIVDHLHLPTAWDIEPGGCYGIGISILDSGIDHTHVDLGAGKGTGYKIAGGYNYICDNYQSMDDHGHGTKVAGVCAALTNNQRGLAGVAGGWHPDTLGCAVHASKVMSSFGVVNSSVAARAIQGCSQNDYGVDVFNASWGLSGGYSESVAEALYWAHKAHRIFVAAKGNSGTSDPVYPADYRPDWVLCVGGSNRPSGIPERRAHVSDGCAYTSNFGGGIDCLAPGVKIVTTARTITDTIYCLENGTSIAAPIVASIAGMVLSRNDTLCANDVEGVICASCDDILTDAEEQSNLQGYDQWSGWGRVRPDKALQYVGPNWHIYHLTDGEGYVADVDTISRLRIKWQDAPGLYDDWYAYRYEVRCDIEYPAYLTDVAHVWGRGLHATNGRSAENPCYPDGYCRAVPSAVTSAGCRLQTYVYDLWYRISSGPPIYQHYGWWPADPDDVVFAYSVLARSCSAGIPEGPGERAGRALAFSVCPNPVTNSARIKLAGEKTRYVRAAIYDIKGRRIRLLRDGSGNSNGEIVWDGKDDDGVEVSPGVYWCRVSLPDGTGTKKMVVMK
jgi:hypothetical protein